MVRAQDGGGGGISQHFVARSPCRGHVLGLVQHFVARSPCRNHVLGLAPPPRGLGLSSWRESPCGRSCRGAPLPPPRGWVTYFALSSPSLFHVSVVCGSLRRFGGVQRQLPAVDGELAQVLGGAVRAPVGSPAVCCSRARALVGQFWLVRGVSSQPRLEGRLRRQQKEAMCRITSFWFLHARVSFPELVEWHPSLMRPFVGSCTQFFRCVRVHSFSGDLYNFRVSPGQRKS